MKRIRITVIRKACYRDLMERYENPLEHPCDLSEGQSFECDGGSRPEGLCESAWQSLSPFVMALAHGATGLYDGWMKNPASAMLSCNDGFRPVSFLVEALDEPTPDGQDSGKQAPAGKEPDRPEPRPGNRPETLRSDASATDAAPAAAPSDSDAARHRGEPAAATAATATSASPTAASAAAPANPETRPYEKTES